MSTHLLVAVALWGSVALPVGIHASSEGRSGVFWGLATLFSGFVGLVVYLIVLVTADEDGDEPDQLRQQVFSGRRKVRCLRGGSHAGVGVGLNHGIAGSGLGVVTRPSLGVAASHAHSTRSVASRAASWRRSSSSPSTRATSSASFNRQPIVRSISSGARVSSGFS